MKKISNWEFWDWKSIWAFFGVTIFIVAALFFFINYPGFVRNVNSRQLNRETVGRFVSSEYGQQLRQNTTGNHLSISAVRVEYSYTVNGVLYYSKDNIPNSSENQSFFKSLSENPSLRLKIKYNSSDPQESQINFNVE
jgi:hypothetical protein